MIPDDIDALKAALIAERAERIAAQAVAAAVQAKLSEDQALIAHQKLRDREAQARRSTDRARSARRACSTRWSWSSRSWRPPPPRTRSPPSGPRRRRRTSRPSRASARRAQPFPEHLPRERVVVPGPTACACCGGTRLRKLGETVTETLEVIPRQWKVIQHVREKMTLPGLREDQRAAGAVPRHAARLGRAAPPGHAAVREVRAAPAAEPSGRALRPGRRAARACRRSPIRSGAGCAVLEPLLQAHRGAMSSPPSGCTATTRRCPCWPRARPTPDAVGSMCAMIARSAGRAPPAAMFYYSRDRGGEHPRGASRRLVRASCRPTPMAATVKLYAAERAARARSWRRPAGRMRAGRSSRSPISRPVPVARPKARRRRRSRRWRWRPSGASMPCSRSSARSTARAPSERRAVRQELSAPLVADLEAWMREERRQALARQRCRQGHGLHAQALGRLHALPRRRPHLPDRTTPPSAPCAASPSAASRGCSPAPIAAASAPPSCTA